MITPHLDPAPLPRSYGPGTPAPATAALDATLETDVAVIGAGIAGLSCALHLRELGHGVAVLEAGEVGAGGSGRAFGLVLPYAKRDHDEIRRTFGEEVGGRIVDAVASGPDLVFELISRHAIACEATRNGWIFGAHTRASLARIAKLAAYWQGRGAPVECLDADATERLVGGRYYLGALFDRRAGGVNPHAYTRGLARAASGLGVRIFTQSRATRLVREGARWRVRAGVGAGTGSVLARQVVIATDAYTDDLWPGLKRSIVPVRAYQLVSEPLSENLRAAILPQRQLLTDTRTLYAGVRLREDGRLQMSVDGPSFSIGGRANIAKAERKIRSLFPQIGDIRWAEEWSGWVGMTKDHLPHLHLLAPDLWAAIGFNGRGIALATLVGRDVARRLAGFAERDLCLPVTKLAPIRGHSLLRPLLEGLIDWYRLRDALEFRRLPSGR
jgi:glycine/D-amino acid oxidase-like deaminating enzyme